MKPSEYLKKLLDKENLNTGVGICTNFEMTHGDSLSSTMSVHKISFEDWQLYSGFMGYPVPYKENSYKSVSDAYTMFNKWDKRTKYGRNRYALLNWLIEQFEAKGA